MMCAVSGNANFMKTHVGIRYIRYGFIMIESILYLWLLFGEFLPGSSIPVVLKYLSILFCLTASSLQMVNQDTWIILVALACTAFADVFLLLLNWLYPLGVLLFSIVQLLYLVRLKQLMGERPGKTLLRRFLVIAFLIELLLLLGRGDMLIYLVVFYTVNLLGNVAESCFKCRHIPGLKIFALGMVLFLCCDVCVALNMVFRAGGYVSHRLASAIWLFYIPAQVCIVLSASQPEKLQEHDYD